MSNGTRNTISQELLDKIPVLDFRSIFMQRDRFSHLAATTDPTTTLNSDPLNRFAKETDHDKLVSRIAQLEAEIALLKETQK